MAADVTVTDGTYSIAGQEEQANILAFGSPNAPEDDSAETDGGQAVDRGDYQQGEDREEHKPSALDEVRAEWQGEEAAQLAEQAEAEAQQHAYEQSFQEGLASYDKLPPEEQFEISTELVGRGLEGMAPLVNFEQAAVLNNELFAGSADGVAAAKTLAYFGDNCLQTLQAAGITDMAQLTPEVAQQLTDPAMASLFAQNLCSALRCPELLEDGIVNPIEMSATLLRHVPALLSGQSADLFPREYKVAFAQDVCRAFGQKQAIRNIDPAAAVALFDAWSKWGGRLRQGLEYHRQQQAAPPQARPARSQSGRSSRQARPSGMFRTNDDIFSEGVAVWNERHAGV
jgi:hypothetical protein